MKTSSSPSRCPWAFDDLYAAYHDTEWGVPLHDDRALFEFLVLEGVFEDEFGEYPAGTYVRNPSGSHHRPGSGPGCLIFVKLRQFQPGDDARLVVDTNAFAHAASGAVAIHPLHRYGDETVAIVDGGEGATHRLAAASIPQEVLVVEGSVRANEQSLGRLGWLRMPAGEILEIEFVTPGRVLTKTRPLPAS